MKMRKIKDSDDAVVGIVVAFLVTGLIVIVISTVQTVYIPKWMEQAEAEHMETVADQFSQLKFSIDTQSAIKQPNTPISTSITLGNKEMPFLMSMRSYGSLDILSNEFNIKIISETDPMFNDSLSTIKYSSVNSYFLNQAYIYEAGAVILSQIEGDTIVIKPAFSVKNGENVTISFTIINISTIEGKRSISGYGTYPIQTEYVHSDLAIDDIIPDVLTLTISTNYMNSWQKFLNNTLINSGLEYNTNFSINTIGNEVSVQFSDNTNVNLDLQIIKISAQIAPGWIENVKGAQ